jgi:hypothetical protein
MNHFFVMLRVVAASTWCMSVGVELWQPVQKDRRGVVVPPYTNPLAFHVDSATPLRSAQNDKKRGRHSMSQWDG